MAIRGRKLLILEGASVPAADTAPSHTQSSHPTGCKGSHSTQSPAAAIERLRWALTKALGRERDVTAARREAAAQCADYFPNPGGQRDTVPFARKSTGSTPVKIYRKAYES